VKKVPAVQMGSEVSGFRCRRGRDFSFFFLLFLSRYEAISICKRRVPAGRFVGRLGITGVRGYKRMAVRGYRSIGWAV
jgi:hypothetical protein